MILRHDPLVLMRKIAQQMGLHVTRIPNNRAAEFIEHLDNTIPDTSVRERFIWLMVSLIASGTRSRSPAAASLGLQPPLPETPAANHRLKALICAITAHYRAKSPDMAFTLRSTLKLKGLDPEHWDNRAAVTPTLYSRFETLAAELGIQVQEA